MTTTVSIPFQGGPLDGTNADVALPPSPVVSVPHMQMVGSETRTRLAQYDLWTFSGVGRNQYRYVFNSYLEIVMPAPVPPSTITSTFGAKDPFTNHGARHVLIVGGGKPLLPDLTVDDIFGDDAASGVDASDVSDGSPSGEVDISHIPPVQSGDSVSITLVDAGDGTITLSDVVLAQEVNAETTLLTDISAPDAEAVRTAKVRDARRRGGQRGG